MSDSSAGVARVGGVIVTHGGLATELLAATQRIVGQVENLRAVSIDWDDDVDDARDQIASALDEVRSERGVLLFTDMFGGTPTNVSIAFLEDGQVEILTGVNLPMLVKLTTLQQTDTPLAEIARQVRDRGQKSVHIASEILSSQEGV